MYTGPLAAVSNREHWIVTTELIDPATNTAVDLTGASVDIAIRPQDSLLNVLTGSLTDLHIAIVGLATAGSFRWTFTPAEMSKLAAGSYDVGLRVTVADGTKYQLIAGVLPVVDGIVDA